MKKNGIHVVLAGNPNSGKSTLFNVLTGLNQTTGNFPGVTVDKRTGSFSFGERNFIVTDLPGIYSLFPRSEDEKVSCGVVLGNEKDFVPEVIVAVADAGNLKRNLFFVTQLVDLGFPVVLALNMIDLAQKNGVRIDSSILEKELGVPVVKLNSRTGEGVEELKHAIAGATGSAIKLSFPDQILNSFIGLDGAQDWISGGTYRDFAVKRFRFLASQVLPENHVLNVMQARETLRRFEWVDRLFSQAVHLESENDVSAFTDKVDDRLTHPVFGILFFLLILFSIFQAVFSLSAYPMDLIESGFSMLGNWLTDILPASEWTDLLVNGVVAGLSGVLVFVPQIALLFTFILILEDTGYMARVSFMMDKLLRGLGLNGRSVIPMIGGFACAVPAIMSARTISSWRERMITIMITPLMSCSARIPVYALLVGLVIPEKYFFGFISLQALVFLGLYLTGIIFALLTAWIMTKFIKERSRSFFVMEMPTYKWPRPMVIVLGIWEKVRIFVVDAGKVILAISVVLWYLSSHGPAEKFAAIEQKYSAITSDDGALAKKDAELLEASYAGMLGHSFEPFIRPLGFDWKIGIALVTSFAAREVFVGTMATIYSAGSEDDTATLREKMAQATHTVSGEPVYTMASGISLLLFYVFSMQCMSTLAIVYRETGSLKWPVIQFVFLGILAYLASFSAYNLLS